MAYKKDMTGKRFGKLVGLKYISIEKGKTAKWLWRCDCGNEVERELASVLNSFKISRNCNCGCNKSISLKGVNKTHGLSKHKLYDVYKQMTRRCYNKRSKDYVMYGNRGISVCKEWKENIHSFFEWAINTGYDNGMSIERIDSNKNYCPENCTWIPFDQQGKNTRRVRYVEFNGRKLSVSDWSRETGISVRTIIQRLNRKWTPERALTTNPVIGRNQYDSKS